VHKRIYPALFLFFGLLAGCGGEDKLDSRVKNLARAEGPVGESSQTGVMLQRGEQPDEGAATVIAGRVLETVDASRYTYILVQTENEGAVWTAVPQVKLAEGESVEVLASVVMKDFKSNTLNRVFPTVVFGVLKGAANQ
jgi:hypothetical protein